MLDAGYWRMADAALFFGSKSGRDIDKFAEFDCKTEPTKDIDSVLLADAVANFECTLESQVPAGDHINTESKKRLYTTGPGHKLSSVS